ncbi:MAG: hypothetical protein M1541_20105 [Acidobacteria bacterium]|nr:hypothetical protein [Acidobacteriota bacterium]
MRTKVSSCRYESFSRRQAIATLACLILFTAWCLTAVPNTKVAYRASSENDSDYAIYQSVVKRMHDKGDGYYDALGGELRSRGRPTRSVFNWRTPLHLSLVAFLPSVVWARVLLSGGVLLALALGFVITLREGSELAGVIQALLMFGVFVPCFAAMGVLFSELWAAVLILISIGAYAFGKRPVAVTAGMLALFFRELALPYVLVCAVLSWRDRRRAECLVWVAGFGAYAAYFAVHARIVTSLVTSGDVANAATWVQLGGARFLLVTASVGMFMILPLWITAFYLPAALLGLGGWTGAVARRVGLTVAAYVAAYSVFGTRTNFYWGAVYAPLLAFGAVRAGAALLRLVPVAMGRRQKSVAQD